jgi:hypothetical protein
MRMTDQRPAQSERSKSEKARRQRRAIRDSKRNIRKLHRQVVAELAQQGIAGHQTGCQCDGCDRARNPEYWAEREAWQAAHPGEDWYLRDN